MKHEMDAHYLSIYLQYTSETENLIERRASNSRYFITINAALVSVVGLVLKLEGGSEPLWLTAVLLSGISVCILWARIILSYRHLTGARFEVIQAMEEFLPTAPYTKEWEMICGDPKYGNYKSISDLERRVPWVLSLLYLILMLAVVAENLSIQKLFYYAQ